MVRGHVFIGGYFYDPFFGPYPWWPRTAYPYRYFPVYDNRAEMRVDATPEEAAVYVDGFYAGIVDDFDGVFQGLPLPPGGHTIVLYLEGFRTASHSIYLSPGSSFKLHHTMERLPPGTASERPPIAPPVPPPPAGSFRAPRTPPRIQTPPSAPVTAHQATGFGTLDLHVQPATAEAAIDGQVWRSSDGGHFVVQLADGPHRVDVTLTGSRPFSTEIQIRDGETVPLNVSLSPATP